MGWHPPRRRTGPTRIKWEDNEQRAVLDWAAHVPLSPYVSPAQLDALQAELQRRPFLADLMFHPANGGARSGVEAKILAGLGVVAGVSDLVLCLPRSPWPGAFIEMKGPPGHDAPVTTEQRRWHALVGAVGYYCAVARGFEEARTVLLRYLQT